MPEFTMSRSQGTAISTILTVLTSLPLMLKVAPATTWTYPATLRSAALSDGVAAAAREDRKCELYKKNHPVDGSRLDFVPLVFEHFGRWGKQAEDFLVKLGWRVKSGAGGKVMNEFLCFWRRHLSVVLQRSHASVLLRKLDRLNPNTTSNANLVSDKVVQLDIH
eukprot:m.246190 g.246190  ORF g.246190 m.246190 type:complete len:164 (+) comp40260_c0_seq1:1697-2188(+)